MTCLAAPVQVEGVPPCGERFYVRSRHNDILEAVRGEDPSMAQLLTHPGGHERSRDRPDEELDLRTSIRRSRAFAGAA
jgi:hypothetical protein